MKSDTIHVRLRADVLDRLKQAAAGRERSVAWLAGRLIEEGMDSPQTAATPAQEQPAAPVAAPPRSRRIVFGSPKVPDHAFAAIEEALTEHGMNLTDGRQVVQITKALPIFHAKRHDHPLALNKDQLQLGIKALLKEGAICRDEAIVWLAEP